MDSNKILDMITNPERYDSLFTCPTSRATASKESVQKRNIKPTAPIRKAGECLVPGTSAAEAEKSKITINKAANPKRSVSEAIAKKGKFRVLPKATEGVEDIEEATTEVKYSDVEAVNLVEDSLQDMFDSDIGKIVGLSVKATKDVPEHIEVSFTVDEQNVVLRVFEDGTVEQVVDAEIIDPSQFSATFSPTKDKDGNVIEGEIDLTLLAVEDDEAEVKTEEDTLPDSEEDNDTFDEEGNVDSEEYVDPAGMNMDDDYSRKHDITPAINAGVKQPQKAPIMGAERHSILRRN